MHLANYVDDATDVATWTRIVNSDEALEHCDVGRAFDKAPHVPIAGKSAVSMLNEKSRVG